MPSIQESVQSSAPGKLITLFQLDMTTVGGSVLYFTPSINPGGTVSFDGQAYTAVPLFAEGFESSTDGSMPRPRFRVSNIGLALNSLMQEYEDLVGALVRRIRTLDRFLDGAADEDPTAILDTQIYRINRKVSQNKVYVEWELASPLDHDAAMLPKGQVLANHCRAIYRRWDPVALDFIVNTTTLVCPYADAAAFDINDQPTTQPLDRCSKTLGGCRVRFGNNAVLPFMAEPGVGRVR